MKVKLFLGLVLLPLSALALWGSIMMPSWKSSAKDILALAQTAGVSQEQWNEIEKKAQEIPRIYPANALHNSIEEVNEIFVQLQQIESTFSTFDMEEKSLEIQTIYQLFTHIKSIGASVKAVDQNVASIPDFLLDADQKSQKQLLRSKLKTLRMAFDQLDILHRVVEDFQNNEERVLILLQNQNEPRPTGGFTGSILILDFSDNMLRWEFKDIYALDRKVPEDSMIPAPDFFHNLSTKISLRDANISPDFKISSQLYQTFFEAAGEKVPGTIVGVNLNLVRELLKFSGPITFEKWNVTANQYNFDMVLSFLVESKISGRFGVKDPVLEFINKILEPSRWKLLDIESLMAWDWQSFLKQKNILAYSDNKKLQKLIELWKLDGSMNALKESDNFMWVDFVSVGANKTEKFMWTKLWHDSFILPNGKVMNTVEIQRRHNLQPGELERLLETENWFENIKDQLNGEMRWKLAEGQNRTVLRLFVPTDSRLITQNNPSGEITQSFAGEIDAKVFEVPMYVSPGEKNTTTIVYETSLKRGSNNWRPYLFQLGTTPGKLQTTFLKTISAEGPFSAETLNIGKPLPIQDSEYRSVVDFRD